jgi:enoyl-CoA hydratase/carnithine racemase
MKDVLLVEKKEYICTLSLNRPDNQNGLNTELLTRLADELKALNKEPDIRVVILRGAGDKVFSAGMDLADEVRKGKSPGDLLSDIPGYTKLIEQVMDGIVDCHSPVIAMIYGDAFAAACDLVVCCDLRVAADTARLSMHPIKVGTTYQYEGIQRFINLLGIGYTKELFFTAKPIDANRAREIGMVNYVVPAGELLPATMNLAKEIAALPPLAVSGTKEVITKLFRQQQRPTAEQIAEFRAISAKAWQSEDGRESNKALFEGRKPHFAGR